MAMTLKLVRLDDFISDIDSVDLTSGGYSLALNGYQPQVAADGDYSVSESITINIQSTSVDALATLVQALDTKIKQVGWWINDQIVERYQVWLRVGLDGETNTRQAMILSIRPPDKLPLFNRLIDNNNLLASYTFAIERTPFWEDPYAYPSTTEVTSVNAAGGIKQMGETINGDIPARLAILSVTPSTGIGQLGEFWIGFKSDRFGTGANFNPVWPLYQSQSLGSDTTSNGSTVTCTFATVATLVSRTVTRIFDVVSDGAKHNDQRGTYMVLLRAKMSDASSIARVKMGYSFGTNLEIYNPVYRSRQPIKGTNWLLYPLGTASIPAMSFPYGAGIQLSTAGIMLMAERYSGSGALNMDRLILIPVDDGAVHLVCPYNTVKGAYANVIQSAEGNLKTYVDTGHYYMSSPSTVEPTNYKGLVANASKPHIVIAAQETPYQHRLNDTVDITYTYIPRWRTLRGTVT